MPLRKFSGVSAASSHGKGFIAAVLSLKARALAMRQSPVRLVRLASIPVSALYRTISLYVVGFDIPTSVRLGEGVVVHHGIGLVINDRAVIGSYVTLRHGTTIGATSEEHAAPIIGDRVDVGSNVVILGPIRVGADAVIGAGSVVVHDVPAGATVVGNPARILGVGRNVE